eukprot:TRINITY_DN2480_c0_g1_i2.p1 TRINITY_DN2480_c0_g1~~TRINITY_DN2480_c0_g1_i2.p1  ORF type:complete len:1341 (+),score=314.62 TRINITY_DN2480_c0_g1_i2:84-4106(+)
MEGAAGAPPAPADSGADGTAGPPPREGAPDPQPPTAGPGATPAARPPPRPPVPPGLQPLRSPTSPESRPGGAAVPAECGGSLQIGVLPQSPRPPRPEVTVSDPRTSPRGPAGRPPVVRKAEAPAAPPPAPAAAQEPAAAPLPPQNVYLVEPDFEFVPPAAPAAVLPPAATAPAEGGGAAQSAEGAEGEGCSAAPLSAVSTLTEMLVASTSARHAALIRVVSSRLGEPAPELPPADGPPPRLVLHKIAARMRDGADVCRAALMRCAATGPVFVLLPAPPPPGARPGSKRGRSAGTLPSPSPWGDQESPVPPRRPSRGRRPSAGEQAPEKPPQPLEDPAAAEAADDPDTRRAVEWLRQCAEGLGQDVQVFDVAVGAPRASDVALLSIRAALVQTLRRRSQLQRPAPAPGSASSEPRPQRASGAPRPPTADAPKQPDPSPRRVPRSADDDDSKEQPVLPLYAQKELDRRRNRYLGYVPGRMFHASPRPHTAAAPPSAEADVLGSGTGFWQPPRFSFARPQPGSDGGRVSDAQRTAGRQLGASVVTAERRQMMLRREVTSVCHGRSTDEKLLEEAAQRYDLLSARKKRPGPHPSGSNFGRTGMYCALEMRPGEEPETRVQRVHHPRSDARAAMKRPAPPRFMYYEYYDVPYLLRKQPAAAPAPLVPTSLTLRDPPAPLPPAAVCELLNLSGAKRERRRMCSSQANEGSSETAASRQCPPTASDGSVDRPFAGFGALERTVLAQGDHLRRTMRREPAALSALIRYAHDGEIDHCTAQRAPPKDRRQWLRQEARGWRDFSALGPQSAQILLMAGELNPDALAGLGAAADRVQRGEPCPRHIPVTQGMGAGLANLEKQEFMMGALIDYHIKQRHTRKARLLAPLRVVPAIHDYGPFSDPQEPPPEALAITEGGGSGPSSPEPDAAALGSGRGAGPSGVGLMGPDECWERGSGDETGSESDDSDDGDIADLPGDTMPPVVAAPPVRLCGPLPPYHVRSPPRPGGKPTTPAAALFQPRPQGAPSTQQTRHRMLQRAEGEGRLICGGPAGRAPRQWVAHISPLPYGPSAAAHGLALRQGPEGPQVESVAADGPAAAEGIQPGQLLLCVGDRPVASAPEATALLAAAAAELRPSRLVFAAPAAAPPSARSPRIAAHRAPQTARLKGPARGDVRLCLSRLPPESPPAPCIPQPPATARPATTQGGGELRAAQSAPERQRQRWAGTAGDIRQRVAASLGKHCSAHPAGCPLHRAQREFQTLLAATSACLAVAAVTFVVPKHPARRQLSRWFHSGRSSRPVSTAGSARGSNPELLQVDSASGLCVRAPARDSLAEFYSRRPVTRGETDLRRLRY